MMEYYHVSPAANAMSIGVHGILTEYADAKSGCVYLVTASQLKWAIRHTRRRHHVRDVVIVPVMLPRRWSMRGGPLQRIARGRWRCAADIYPCKMGVFRYER